VHAHKLNVTVPDSHQLVVRLPDDFPPGEAEIIVVSSAAEEPAHADDFASLEEWAASLPTSPPVPLDAFERGELYR
jgi:hypothetical protein